MDAPGAVGRRLSKRVVRLAASSIAVEARGSRGTVDTLPGVEPPDSRSSNGSTVRWTAQHGDTSSVARSTGPLVKTKESIRFPKDMCV